MLSSLALETGTVNNLAATFTSWCHKDFRPTLHHKSFTSTKLQREEESSLHIRTIIPKDLEYILTCLLLLMESETTHI